MGNPGDLRNFPPVFPDNPSRKERNKKTVGIIGIVDPLIDEGTKNAVVERGNNHQEQRELEPCPSIRPRVVKSRNGEIIHSRIHRSRATVAQGVRRVQSLCHGIVRQAVVVEIL
jgi:hypothetical protein